MMVSFTSKHPDKVFYSTCPHSPAGKLLIGLNEREELVRVSFLQSTNVKAVRESWQKEWPHTTFIKAFKDISFAECCEKPLLLIGTEFQQKVWHGLLTLKEGETLSYGALAARIKKPKAARAVGSACGKNPIALIVPCHRVIASDGTLGGFSSDIGIKKRLLEREGVYEGSAEEMRKKAPDP